MRAEDRVRLLHMIDAAESIDPSLAGRELAHPDQDRMLPFASVRMRNRPIHGYFDVDTEIVWSMVSREIPTLPIRLRTMAATGQDGH